MKIVMLLDNLSAGGIQASALKILENCAGEKTLILFRKCEELSIPRNIQVIRLSDSLLSRPTGFTGWVKRAFFLRRAFQQIDPDLVFSMGFTVNILLIISRWLFGGKHKCVLGVRNSLSELYLTRSRLNPVRFFTPWLYKYADEVIVVSKGIADEFVAGGVEVSRVEVIRNGYDLAKIRRLAEESVSHVFYMDKSAPVIVAAGRFSKQKNFALLLKALKIINGLTPCRLVLLGDGPEKPKLQMLVDSLGLRERVAFLGQQDNPYKYFKKSDIFVLSSLWEGFPNVIVEAMACGLPVVSTRCPTGPSEILTDWVDGVLVPIDSPQALASVVYEIITKRSLRESMASSAYKSAERFPLEEMIRNYNARFSSILYAA